MRFEGELPRGRNVRGGPGWWMDNEGFWRAPEEWPEDDPPLPGWIRDASGRWRAPSGSIPERASETRWDRTGVDAAPGTALAVVERPESASEKRRSRQARADRRAMFLVTGAIGGAVLLLVGALLLITQAGAAPDPVETEVAGPAVVYAAETEDDQRAKREQAAGDRPDAARTQLDALALLAAPPEGLAFEPDLWTPVDDGCLGIDERVLIARSSGDLTYADQLECVLDTGRWRDPWLGRSLSRTVDVDVVLHVPAAHAWHAGGWNWTSETRQAYLTDLDHPATRQVVATDTGHNPRAQGPADWRPADAAAWCAYAVDWVAVSHRWNLGVTDAERTALGEMLDSCDSPTSRGANPDTTTLDEPAPPAIGLLGQ